MWVLGDVPTMSSMKKKMTSTINKRIILVDRERAIANSKRADGRKRQSEDIWSKSPSAVKKPYDMGPMTKRLRVARRCLRPMAKTY